MDILDNLYKTAVRLSTSIALSVQVLTDTLPRFVINGNGDHSWADGTNAIDTVLKRITGPFLDVTTGGFSIGGIPIPGNGVVNCTASTLAVTQVLHAGRIVTLNRAAGIAVTLPAATGTGAVYKFIVGTTFTGAATIAVVDGTDFFIGTASMGIDGGTFVPHQYPTANTGTLATESDTISLFGTANSQGGFKGEMVELIDIATDTWFVRIVSDAGGTEATPFSAAV